MNRTEQIGRGVVYFCIGLAIGGVFYLFITTGWRSSVRETQLRVQSLWALNEHQWDALEYLSQKILSIRPKDVDAWRHLVISAMAKSDWDSASERMEIYLSLSNEFDDQNASLLTKNLQNRTFNPPPSVPENELPKLGEPMVRASVESLVDFATGQPIITVRFSQPVYSTIAARSATFYDEETGFATIGRFPTLDEDPLAEKTTLQFVPVRTLNPASTYLFVLDLKQQRLGGAWLVYPLIFRISQHKVLSAPD